MGATIVLAKQITSGLILHINDVDKKLGLTFSCVGCGREMIPVRSNAKKRDWHFRHPPDSLCSGGRDTALHDLVVQILMGSSAVRISKKLEIEYCNPRKEVGLFSKRSDATITYENEDLHFEVFVTHDLDQEKIDIYKNNKIKCVRIDLSHPKWLRASSESIQYAVLRQYENKTLVYWQDQPMDKMSESFNLRNFFFRVVVAIGLVWLIRTIFFNRTRN